MRTSVLSTVLGVLSLSAGAPAQVSFPQLHTTPFGPFSTTWSGGFNLGTPAPLNGGYTRYLIVTDWFGSGIQNSTNLRVALHGGPLGPNPGGEFSGPAGSGPRHATPSTQALGSTAVQSEVNNLWWRGNIAANAPIGGGNPVYLSVLSNQPGSNGRIRNTVVTLNPRIDDRRTFRGQVVPAPDLLPQTFTDLGTLSVSGTELSRPVSASTGPGGIRWFKFAVDRAVNPTDRTAFDLFTTGGTSNALDSQLVLFRQTSAGLLPVSSSDDVNGTQNRAAALSFGSPESTLFGRGYGLNGAGTYFRGQGGNEALGDEAALPMGYFANQPGSASLAPTETYWLAVAHGSLVLSGTTITQSLGEDRRSIVWSGEVVYGLGGPTSGLETTLNIRAVPGPSTAAGLALLLGLANRRRR